MLFINNKIPLLAPIIAELLYTNVVLYSGNPFANMIVLERKKDFFLNCVMENYTMEILLVEELLVCIENSI